MVKAACLQTELGLLPAAWRTATVKDILQLRRGRVISHRDIIKATGPYPVYSSQTYNNGVMGSISSFDFEGEYITWTTDGANAGTVFFRFGKFNCTNVCGTGRPINPSHTSACFFAYYLDTVAWKHVSHVGNPKLMSGPFGDIPVVVPPSVEQRAIAEALSDADALIAALDALIAKKRDLKQAAMQQLLTGKIRLPGFAGEWELKKLGEAVTIRNNKINTFQNELALFCIELEQILQNSGQIVGHLDAHDRNLIKYIFYKNDVLFGRLRPYLRKYWLSDRAGVCSTEIWPLIPVSNQLIPGFLFYIVQSYAFFDAANCSFGTHMPRADWSTLERFEFLIPIDVKEQSAIATVLSDMDAELAGLESQRDKARAIKQGMMQELLTGRIRLI